MVPREEDLSLVRYSVVYALFLRNILGRAVPLCTRVAKTCQACNSSICWSSWLGLPLLISRKTKWGGCLRGQHSQGWQSSGSHSLEAGATSAMASWGSSCVDTPGLWWGGFWGEGAGGWDPSARALSPPVNSSSWYAEELLTPAVGYLMKATLAQERACAVIKVLVLLVLWLKPQ